jgi:hypothetical protein
VRHLTQLHAIDPTEEMSLIFVFYVTTEADTAEESFMRF